MGNFILSEFPRDFVTGDPISKKLKDFCWSGKCWVVCPPDQHITMNPTTPPGGTTGVYYGLLFQLRKWEYQVHKADEWIEVAPAHTQYYQMIIKQKEELENRIKSGLSSAAQSIADLELLKHDERKYREFLNYFGWKFENGALKKDDKIKDEHAVRAIFIDQVDVHTGEGISMRSIVSRWPTLITDFMRLNDNDINMDDVKKKLDVSKAEAVVLVTKNKLYLQWKSMFEPEMKTRYARITSLVQSRETSVEQYKEWLKPVITRHKILNEGLSRPENRGIYTTSFMTSLGNATAQEMTTICAWKDISPHELTKAPGEILAKKPIDCYDDWTKKNLIFHKEHGLIADHPWITDAWVKKQKEFFFNADGKGANPKWLLPHKPYYTMIDLGFMRGNTRLASGAEIEDSLYNIGMVFMTQNAMFAKLLQLQAKKEEMERYINNMLGIPNSIDDDKQTKSFMAPQKDSLKPVKDFLNYFSLNFQFMKRGPYERDFKDRITKRYLTTMGADRYGPVVNFVKEKIGYGA